MIRRGVSQKRMMMIRCRSILSLSFSLFYIFFQEIYARSRLSIARHFWKRKTRQVIDRFLLSFFCTRESVCRCWWVNERKNRVLYLSFSLSLSRLFVQKLHNTINSRPIIAKDQSRISFSRSIKIKKIFSPSPHSSLYEQNAQKKKKPSDNGSLSHIILCYEYFIRECKHRERGKKEFQSSLHLFSSSECLSLY